MKIIVILLLIFTIFTDFTSASTHNEELSSCMSQISCLDVDLHSSNDTQHNDSENEHGPCHAGHSHTAIVSSTAVESKPLLPKGYISYPMFQIGKTESYLIDIIRPPIA